MAAESRQSEILDGFQFYSRAGGAISTPGVVAQPSSDGLYAAGHLNGLDRISRSRASSRIASARGTRRRRSAHRSAGLIELQGLRNGVAREMGYDDFFQFQVSNTA